MTLVGRQLVSIARLPSRSLCLRWISAFLLCFSPVLFAQPRIAIIIDDLGYNAVDDRAIVDLPGAVTCAFLPAAPYSRILAEEAHRQGKEVMLHLPMDSIDDRPLGHAGLTVGMSRRQFVSALRRDLQAIPHISGVNNHMGSLLTQLPDNMVWLMNELRRWPLFFIDSRTTSDTVAQQFAESMGVPVQRRDVFLDNIPTLAAIDRQFEKLLLLARRRGQAVAIGHPYPQTLALLQSRLARLAEEGVELVSVSHLLNGDLRTPQPYMAASERPIDELVLNAHPVSGRN